MTNLTYKEAEKISKELRKQKLECIKNMIVKETPPYTIWKFGRALQLNFRSIGCRLGGQGYCLVCNYGKSVRNITIDEANQAIIDISNIISDGDITELIIGTYGNLFDASELSTDILEYILRECDKLKGLRAITLESHYITITDEVIRLIKRNITHNKVAIEMGLESSDIDISLKSYNKYIEHYDLSTIIQYIKENGFEVCLNIMFGAPFIDKENQKKDTLDSVKWAFEHGADDVVLFPINVKPNTLLYKLYQDGKYIPINHWDFIDVLNSIDDDKLGYVTISWIGDRQESGGIWSNMIPPNSCDKCKDLLGRFYTEYKSASTSKQRKDLLVQLIKNKPCNCGQ